MAAYASWLERNAWTVARERLHIDIFELDDARQRIHAVDRIHRVRDECTLLPRGVVSLAHPRLVTGQHADAILTELGYSAERIVGLRERKVVG